MSKPDYTALALAAAAGAIGALSVQYLMQWIAWGESSSLTASKKRRGSILPDQQQFGKRSIRAICWDMDGTLIKTELIWFSLLKDALSEFGYDAASFTYDVWYPHFGQSMQRNVDLWFPGLDVAQLDEYCNTNYHKKIELLEVMEHAPEVLQFANELTDHRTFLCTNCPRPIVELILASEKGKFLKTAFTDAETNTLRILCPNDIGSDGTPIKSKPTTSMIMEVAKTVGVSSHEIIMVGDSCFDIECISAAGGLAIELSVNHEHKQASQYTPFLKITSLDELFQIQQLFIFPAVSQ